MTSLTAGIMQAASSFSLSAGGFHAYVSTDGINAAGVSSSAAFEMLICCILNFFFNKNTMSCLDYAKTGQYADVITNGCAALHAFHFFEKNRRVTEAANAVQVGSTIRYISAYVGKENVYSMKTRHTDAVHLN